MKLKNLTIKLQEAYQDDAGKYVAKCEWEQKNESKVILSHEVAEKLLLFLAPLLEEYTRLAAINMANAITMSVQEARQLPETTV
jgi:hypothetical protein